MSKKNDNFKLTLISNRDLLRIMVEAGYIKQLGCTNFAL